MHNNKKFCVRKFLLSGNVCVWVPSGASVPELEKSSNGAVKTFAGFKGYEIAKSAYDRTVDYLVSQGFRSVDTFRS